MQLVGKVHLHSTGRSYIARVEVWRGPQTRHADGVPRGWIDPYYSRLMRVDWLFLRRPTVAAVLREVQRYYRRAHVAVYGVRVIEIFKEG